MRFGFNLVNNGPGATPEALIERGRFAEEVGFHIVMVSDHTAVTPDVAQLYPTPLYDPFVVLAHLAATTTQVELGTTILVIPYRHPLLTARMAANIDQLSSSRLIIGAGAGWSAQEYAALGIDYTVLPRHRRRTHRQLSLVIHPPNSCPCGHSPPSDTGHLTNQPAHRSLLHEHASQHSRRCRIRESRRGEARGPPEPGAATWQEDCLL